MHRKAQAAEKLAAGPAYADQALVFADEIGDPLAPEAVSAAFKRHVREAALPRLTIHGLRHTYATIALDAGVDVLYVAELLGHSSPAITREIYQHVRRTGCRAPLSGSRTRFSVGESMLRRLSEWWADRCETRTAKEAYRALAPEKAPRWWRLKRRIRGKHL